MKAMCRAPISSQFSAGLGFQRGFPEESDGSFEQREAAGIFLSVYLIPNPAMKQTHIIASTPVLLDPNAC